MRKTLATMVVALGLVGATSGTAFAGERGGNGEATPVQGHIASSECSFSGLEDWDDDGDGTFDAPVQPGVVQNWGSIPKFIRDMIAAQGAHPGTACNGSAKG